MESPWVRSRYENYRKQQDKMRLKEQSKVNAISAYPSMFERLKSQVAEDMKVYNASFSMYAADQVCKAGLEPNDAGFAVSVGTRKVAVGRQRAGTIIDISYELDGTALRADHLEVASDEKGALKYQHGREMLDENQASLLILDPILCGGEAQ